jgi:hypothetical protein
LSFPTFYSQAATGRIASVSVKAQWTEISASLGLTTSLPDRPACFNRLARLLTDGRTAKQVDLDIPNLSSKSIPFRYVVLNI